MLSKRKRPIKHGTLRFTKSPADFHICVVVQHRQICVNYIKYMTMINLVLLFFSTRHNKTKTNKKPAEIQNTNSIICVHYTKHFRAQYLASYTNTFTYSSIIHVYLSICTVYDNKVCNNKKTANNYLCNSIVTNNSFRDIT